MPKPSPETPVSFADSLPTAARAWVWLAHSTVTLTLAMPDGPALADYILLFRKPGENPVPIVPDVDNDTWIQWARPVWYGIKETETLNAAEAREEADDRHICPLQLGVIERCIRLWSNPGDLICDPFAGIGSTGFVALQQDRRFVGCELKPLYAATAQKNLSLALQHQGQQRLL